jgi:hypothetical protein
LNKAIAFSPSKQFGLPQRQGITGGCAACSTLAAESKRRFPPFEQRALEGWGTHYPGGAHYPGIAKVDQFDGPVFSAFRQISAARPCG